MNKLIFLGTGNAAHLTRQMTSLCIDTPKGALLIDCGDGMGTVRQLVRAGVDLASVNDVFITHRHADHVIGMPHFLFLKMLDKSTSVRVWGPDQALRVVKQISFLTHDLLVMNKERIAFCVVSPWKSRVVSNGCRVTAAPVRHISVTTYALKVEVDGKSIVFTSDMGPNDNIERLSNGTDILIHECFGLSKGEDRFHAGHSSAKDAGVLAQKAGVKQLILTHFPAGVNFVEPEALASEARLYFKGEVRIAKDLMELCI
ncbi:MBL fold metallo-hydrolase [Patescibacteria group bacterium]|nr:MBL fold metallo-hydrolase [Patescibacteria group bacterium]MBU1473088.1 MBL fold metallo-hydrolase [Patescibacteria group bacterium]MBU2459625.1 MBL fold metallo-hydrolase [Patescibacteria group bacterium]MBU2544472.1 MBL fold metallo-hydrolase [Patescibacteria group bacterium]